MSNTLQVLEKKLSKPTTVAEAIEMDSRLEYISIPVDLQQEIISIKDMDIVIYEGLTMNADVLKQIRRYQVKDVSNVQLIIYNDPDGSRIVLKAVSGVFHPIPLQEVWEKAVERLGEPIEEKATNQAIIAQFSPVKTKYLQNGLIADTDYEVKPTIAFSFNFAERSFQLGFVIGVFHCTNQIFSFFGDSRIIHNRHKIQAADFTVESALNKLMDNLTRLEEIIEEAQKTPLPDYATPILYWKGSRGQTKVLEGVYAQHAKLVVKKGQENLTLWDAVMNLTWVSTHEVANYNSSVDMSMVAGQTLIKMGSLVPEDYIKGLGWYMEHKRRTTGQTWKDELSIFQRVNLVPLMKHSRTVIQSQIDVAETIAIEKSMDQVQKGLEQAVESPEEEQITTVEFIDDSVPTDVKKYLTDLSDEDKSNMFNMED